MKKPIDRSHLAAARVCDERANAFDAVISTLSHLPHKLRAEGKASGSRSCASNIRALPLPVSEDGSSELLEACKNLVFWDGNERGTAAFHKIAEIVRALKSTKHEGDGE